MTVVDKLGAAPARREAAPSQLEGRRRGFVLTGQPSSFEPRERPRTMVMAGNRDLSPTIQATPIRNTRRIIGLGKAKFWLRRWRARKTCNAKWIKTLAVLDGPRSRPALL